MTLEAFALATSARAEGGGDEPAALLRKVEIAARISDALQLSDNTYASRLMPGVGLCRDGAYLFPTVLADRFAIRTDSEVLTQLGDFPVLRDALASVMGDWPDAWAEELRILPVSQGFLHSAPGSELLCTMGGRVGPHVRWAFGNEGFLTAGHVAQTVGSHVTDIHGSSLGTVQWSNDPASAGSRNADLDVALVEFDSAYAASTGRSSIVAGAGDVLEVTSSKQQAAVFGFFNHVVLGGAQARYAQCYATEKKITKSGDSGGLVEAQGDVVGMVIGGFARRDMTLVQAVDYQLGEIRNRSSYMVSL